MPQKLRVHRHGQPCHTGEAPWSGHSHSIISRQPNSLIYRVLRGASMLMSVDVYENNSCLVAIDGE